MQVGSIVVCKTGPKFPIQDGYGNIITHYQPITGELYTVRELFDNGAGIYLEEIINKPVFFRLRGMFEPGFLSERFEEIQSPNELEDILLEINQVLS